MNNSKRLTLIFGAVAVVSTSLLVVSGAQRISENQGVYIDDNTRIIAPTGSGAAIHERLYDCTTERDFEQRIAVTTCKMGFEVK